MARGFVSGMIWGAVFSGIAVATVSLIAPLPKLPDVALVPTQGAADAPATGSGTPASGQDGDLVERAPTAPDGATNADTVEALDKSASEQTPVPGVGGASTLTSPDAETDQTPAAPAIAATGDGTQPEAPAAPNAPAPASAPSPDTTTPTPGSAAGGGALPQITTPEPTPEIAAVPQAPTSPTAPAIGETVVPLTERSDKRASALPVVTEPTENAAVRSDAQLSPLDAYAEPFSSAEQKPLMAVVLIDDAQSLGAEALENFPYPLSFAIDPTLPDAVSRMAARRAAGFEVVSLVELPTQATPQDAEVTLMAAFQEMPQTVAVLEGPESGFQGNRALADQVSAIVEQSGRGLITQDNGLNTVQKLAQRAGIPSATVFRDFDGAGQTPVVMRRFLDQAAFRARQEGGVIMLGRVRPDTISALLLWGLQDRASQVSLVPVSTLLKQSVAEAE